MFSSMRLSFVHLAHNYWTSLPLGEGLGVRVRADIENHGVAWPALVNVLSDSNPAGMGVVRIRFHSNVGSRNRDGKALAKYDKPKRERLPFARKMRVDIQQIAVEVDA